MKLKVFAPVTVLDARAPGKLKPPICDLERLAALDGVAYEEECFSDHLPYEDPITRSLAEEEIVSGGYLRFRFDAEVGELWAETEYELRRGLTEAEIACILSYTTGQWSDGIGENFCPEYAEQTGLFLYLHRALAAVEMAA